MSGDVLAGAILGIAVALATVNWIGTVLWDVDWYDIITENEIHDYVC